MRLARDRIPSCAAILLQLARHRVEFGLCALAGNPCVQYAHYMKQRQVTAFQYMVAQFRRQLTAYGDRYP